MQDARAEWVLRNDKSAGSPICTGAAGLEEVRHRDVPHAKDRKNGLVSHRRSRYGLSPTGS